MATWMTSIELVDKQGLKTRVNISGHWPELVHAVTGIVMAATAGDPQVPFDLSDFETWER